MTLLQRYRWIILLVCGGIVFIGLLYATYTAYRQGQASYSAFLRAEERHMTAAVIPSIADNPIRQELNQVLAESLAEGLTAEERLRRAKRGIELLKDAERQIDMTMATRDTLIAAITDMRTTDGAIVRLLLAFDTSAVTAIAEKQMLLVDDIRGLSYRANFHTSQIFEQLIQDGGVLTSAHVIRLNELIPLVEEQFDRRSNLYSELAALHDQVIK